MASSKKKATAKTSVRFKDLKSKKDPKGGPIYMNYGKTELSAVKIKLD
jgi:hypothetical protein